MKTTIELDDALLRRAKETALKHGTTLRAVIEQALRVNLAGKRADGGKGRKRLVLPISKARGGLRPGVDLTDSRDLEDTMNS